MQDQIETVAMLVIKGVVIPLVGLFIAWASAKLPAWIGTKVKNESAAGVLERLTTLVFAVVNEVEQTVVSNLGDKADAAALRGARDQALATIKSHLGEKGLKELETVLGLDGSSAVDKLIVSFIESAVLQLGQQKAQLPAPAAPAPASTPASSQAGFARVGLMLVIAAVGALAFASCGTINQCKQPENANSLKCTAINVAVDCTKDVAPAVLQQVGTVFEKVVLENTSADGSVDWSHVWNVFGGIGASWGSCLIGNMIDNYAAAPPKLEPGEIKPSVDELKKGLSVAKTTYHLAPTDKIKTARSVHQ